MHDQPQKKTAARAADSAGVEPAHLPTDSTSTFPAGEAGIPSKLFSPLRFLVITIGGIFLAEVVAMLAIYRLQSLPYYLQVLVDATMMVVMIFPLVYNYSLKPLIRHIEERTRAGEALRQSQERFSKIFHSSPAALSIARLEDGTFIDVNQSFLHLFGYDREEVIDQSMIELNLYVDGGEGAKLGQQPVARKLLESQGIRDYEIDARRKSGELRDVLISTEGIVLGGEPCLLATVSDITARKRAEESNLLLSRIVQQTQDTVVVTNHDGVIEYVNPAFLHLTGYTKDEALGKNPRVIKSGIHDAEFYRDLWNTILRGEVFQSEIANRKKNGEVFYEVKTISPLRDERGNLTHFVATGKDITEHKIDEQKLHTAYADLELRVQDRTEELRIANSELELEIIERRQAEQKIRDQNAVAESVNRILDAALTVSTEEQLGQICLEVAAQITGSEFGFIGEVGADGLLHDIAISPMAWDACNMTDAAGHHLAESFQLHGIYGRVLLDGTGFYTNDLESHPDWIGTPAGHPPLKTFLGVPLMHDHRTVGMIALANRDGGYSQDHVAVTESLAPVIMQAFLHKRTEEQLKRFNEAMVGRELRMIELKNEINELRRSAGQLPRYSLDFEKG